MKCLGRAPRRRLPGRGRSTKQANHIQDENDPQNTVKEVLDGLLLLEAFQFGFLSVEPLPKNGLCSFVPAVLFAARRRGPSAAPRPPRLLREQVGLGKRAILERLVPLADVELDQRPPADRRAIAREIPDLISNEWESAPSSLLRCQAAGPLICDGGAFLAARVQSFFVRASKAR